MPTWLTITEIARRLGRPPATVSSWRDRHPAYVPSRRESPRRITYPLERLMEIGALYERGITAREVQAELERRHGEHNGEPPETFEGAVLEELRAIRAALNDLPAIRLLLERIAARLDERS